MIHSIDISNLRGIRQGRLDDLTNIVLIVGPNNSGKSTILDGLFIAANPNPEQAVAATLQRRSVVEPGNWLLHKANGAGDVEGRITVTSDGLITRRIDLLPPSLGRSPLSEILVSSAYEGEASRLNKVQTRIPGTPTRDIFRSPPLSDVPDVHLIDSTKLHNKSPLPDLYTRVVEKGMRLEAKAIVKDLMPEVEDIEILTKQNQPVMYLVFPKGAHPVELAGDGIRLLLRMSLELATSSGGLILLEEPETHMHPGAIRQSILAILATMRRGAQVVLTTHSLDLIDALLATAKDDELDKIAIYRVLLDHGTLKSHRLSGREAALARTQIEDDLR